MWIALSVGVFLLIGLSYAWWHYMEHRFTTVTPGKAYRCSAMTPKELARIVKRNGIKTVIDLRTEGEGAEKIAGQLEALEQMEGVTGINLPSPQVPTAELVEQYLDIVGNEENRPFLVHCNHGEGRAVLYGALYEIEFEGKDPEVARKGCRVITTKGSSFDTDKVKGKFLREYERRSR